MLLRLRVSVCVLQRVRVSSCALPYVHVSVCVCLSVCALLCVCMFLHVCGSVCALLRVHVSLYPHISVCLRVSVCVRVSVCSHVSVCVLLCVRFCMCASVCSHNRKHFTSLETFRLLWRPGVSMVPQMHGAKFCADHLPSPDLPVFQWHKSYSQTPPRPWIHCHCVHCLAFQGTWLSCTSMTQLKLSALSAHLMSRVSQMLVLLHQLLVRPTRTFLKFGFNHATHSFCLKF